MFLLGRTLQHTRVGEDNGGILIAVGHAIDHDAVQLARLEVFLLYVEVAVGDSVIEDSLRDFQLRTLLLHRDEKLCQLHVGAGTDVVLKVERADHHEDSDDDERPESLHQRDASGLDGSQLRAFSQVAEGDKRRKQDGQRQSLWYKHESHVPEELRHDFHRQTFTYQFVDVSPQELHHQHKLADEECSHEKQPELLRDEYI